MRRNRQLKETKPPSAYNATSCRGMAFVPLAATLCLTDHSWLRQKSSPPRGGHPCQRAALPTTQRGRTENSFASPIPLISMTGQCMSRSLVLSASRPAGQTLYVGLMDFRSTQPCKALKQPNGSSRGCVIIASSGSAYCRTWELQSKLSPRHTTTAGGPIRPSNRRRPTLNW